MESLCYIVYSVSCSKEAIALLGKPTTFTHAAQVACARHLSDAVACRKKVENSLGDIQKTSKAGGSGEQANKRRGGVEREDRREEGGGAGERGRPMSTGAPNGGRERSVPAKNHTVESGLVRTKSIPNSIPGVDQTPFPAMSNTIFQEEEERNQQKGDSATRPRKFVRQRPLSASAATVSAFATNAKGRDFVSPAAFSARGRATLEDHQKTGSRTGKSSKLKGGTRPREIPICWGGERLPGRRPTPLGKTNTPKTVAKVECFLRMIFLFV